MRWDVLSMSAAGRSEDLWTGAGESGDSWLDIGSIPVTIVMLHKQKYFI